MRSVGERDENAVKMIVVLMGVSGVGKTTVGIKLADVLGFQFADADNYHPPSNVAKMTSGIPLDDSDRAPWLHSLEQAGAEWVAEGKNVVLACSALKSSFRESLRNLAPQQIQFVYLKADFKSVEQRVVSRSNHFMGKELLRSQFDALEEPRSAIQIDATQRLDAIVSEIKSRLSVR